MGISSTTFYRWQQEHREIRDSLKKGKAPVDTQVENALLKRALGYDYTETVTEFAVSDTEVDEDGKPKKIVKAVKMTKKHMAPDVGAAAFWLKNRRPDRWRDKREEQIKVTGADYTLLDEVAEAVKRDAQQ